MYEDYFYIRIQMKNPSPHEFKFLKIRGKTKFLSYFGNCMSCVANMFWLELLVTLTESKISKKMGLLEFCGGDIDHVT